jgi:hypothetical protein
MSDRPEGKVGRSPRRPTPPGTETVGSEPATGYDSKTVMLRAERHDEIEITSVENGMRNVPERFVVVRRDETYYGPSLLLDRASEDHSENYELTCPGRNSQLMLWMAVTGKDDQWRNGWMPVSEVRAKIADIEQYNECDICGDPLKDIWHERLSAVGICDEVEW